MGCCTPNEIGAGAEAASPCKRVNFTLGMLLGVDDFVQESAYHLRPHARAGARAAGLRHRARTAGGDRGGRRQRAARARHARMACCPRARRCAWARPVRQLNDWLKAHKAELPTPSGSGKQSLYVVLSHAECLTDNVPIPASPAATTAS